MFWSNLSIGNRPWQQVLFTASAVAGLTIAANFLGSFQLLEWGLLDRFFRSRPVESPDPRIVLVTIDDPDIAKIGQWPLPNSILVELLEKLKAQHPRVLGLGLYRDLPTGKDDRALEEIFASTPNLIGVEKVVGDTVEPPPILSQNDRVGMVDLLLDADGKVRRALMSAKTEEGLTRLSFGLRLGLMYLEPEGIALTPIHRLTQRYQLGQAVFVPFSRNDGGYVDADDGGYQVLLNYRGELENFQRLSLTDVLENRIPPNVLRDRVILVGSISQKFTPFFYTPYSSNSMGLPSRSPGLVIQANITSQVLTGALDGRPFLRVGSEPQECLWIWVWSMVGGTLSWTCWQAPRLKGNMSLTLTVVGWVTIGTGLILAAASFAAFLGGWWLPVVAPTVALLGSAGAIAASKVRQLQQDKTDLEILLQTTAEHSDTIAAQLYQRAESTLRESYARLTQFMEAMPVGVAVLDAEGKIYYTNRRAQQLLGPGGSPSVTSQKLSEFYQIYLAGSDRLYPHEKLVSTRALRGETSRADDLEIHRDDKVIPIESWGTPIYDCQGNIKYALIAFQDLSERQKAWSERILFAQELEAKNMALQEMDRLKDEFLKRTNHELRTPLNGIMGSLQLIVDGFCDDRQEEMELLQQAHQSSRRLFELIEDIIELSHLKAGEVELEIREIDLHSCLTKALYLQLPNLQDKKLKLLKQYSNQLIQVRADANKLREVFSHIIGNAIKFTQRGSITVTTQSRVKTSTEGEETAVGIVTIQDTGVGIDPTLKDRMFEAFMMEDGSPTRPYDGNGLGLTISQSFINMMGGGISLSSEGKGKGTTVTITLPLALATQSFQSEEKIERIPLFEIKN